MPRLLRAVVPLVIAAFSFALIIAPATASDSIALSRLAPALGYTYTWIGSESAVALTRPGLYVLVRTGNPLYDVNDSVESTSQAPQFRDNDIYVGSGLIARLRTLARKYPMRDKSLALDPAPAPALDMSAHGALALSVVPTLISDAVVVSGSGPANVPLTITFSADISRELPRVVLSRTHLQTGADGTFSTQISTAPLHLQKSIVLVSATSVPGVTEAHTSFILGQPNPSIAHPVDELPRDFKPH